MTQCSGSARPVLCKEEVYCYYGVSEFFLSTCLHCDKLEPLNAIQTDGEKSN